MPRMDHTEAETPQSLTKLYATLVGAGLVMLGILGFFYSASFDTGSALRTDDILGVFATNGWHNLLYITTGLLGLAAAGSASRPYSLGIGTFYLAFAIWGFASAEHGHAVFADLIPVDLADDTLHLLLGAAGIGAWAAGRERGARGARSKAKGA